MRIWRPKDFKAQTIIKLALWSGLSVWAILTVVMSIALARKFATYAQELFTSTYTSFLGNWVVPTWVIFTTLLLIWAVFRFAYNRLRRK